ncbi:MAG: mannose-1-phosphate guanylyltransferase/mannose-6-phosphate isomerase [Gammaproteobacteria bacterium]|nr:mannose-1-phosphate guanylyltransferase/mannose-6-phosphate isomerase [Gammaproteobacteria bacterium]
MSRNVHPIILCGGSGTRLWPLSRSSFPKQFAQLTGTQSLFQATIERLSGPDFAVPLVITSDDYRFVVTEQLGEQNANTSTILIEPAGRNTAPAVLASAIWLEKTDPDALMLLSPSDHVIPDADLFVEAVKAGVSSACDGELLTFGIKPDRAETGYGWLELDTSTSNVPIKISAFKEKPNQTNAEAMLASGTHLWNSGIFLFSVKAILEAFEQHEPEMLSLVRESVQSSKPDLNFIRLDSASWNKVKSISIDYAIMERVDNISVVPFNGRWSDLGGWDAVWRESDQDDNGVVLSGQSTALACKNTLLRSESDTQELVGLGLEDTIVVSMSDAVLVADASRAQEVKDVVELLKDKGAKQSNAFSKDHRPWGWFETLALSDRFQVKQIVVKPGGILSLQSHMHRAEHWIVVSGTAKVTIGDKEQLVTENQSVYIPLGETHRMENPGKLPMVLIEVQTGAYLGEDDIVRYEDVYSRE